MFSNIIYFSLFNYIPINYVTLFSLLFLSLTLLHKKFNNEKYKYNFCLYLSFNLLQRVHRLTVVRQANALYLVQTGYIYVVWDQLKGSCIYSFIV